MAVEVELEGNDDLGFNFEGEYRVSFEKQTVSMAPSSDSDDRVRQCFEPLLGVPISRAVACESGELWVRFADGSLLESGPGDLYEPRSYYGPGRIRVWSLPGGRITVARAP